MENRFAVRHGGTRVVFGAGVSATIGREIEALGVERVLVVSSPRGRAEAERLAEGLGTRSAGVLAAAREHVPSEVAAAGRAATESAKADAVLAVGGGSAIGLAKAIALHVRIRVAAVPTTYSGSEMTSVYGITEGSEKKTGRDERVRPALVVYDPSLTLSLPREVTVASLWNAMAHAVEALWARDADRSTSLTAEEALRLLASSVTRLAARLDDADARHRALEGACLAGLAFGDAGGGLHHRLCHVLGGAFDLPHAATHAALLPHVVRFTRDAAPDAMRAIARAVGVLDPVDGIERLARQTGVARGLSQLGMPRDGVERVVDMIMAAPPVHPGGVERASLEALLLAAWTAPAAASAHAAPLRAPAKLTLQPGFGGTHESEAIAGALPRRQNQPHPAPFGLYPDVLSGTPFTVKSAENTRLWMYRIRASFSHSVYAPVPSARFAAPLLDVNPNRTRWLPLPIPAQPARADFLDGLVTLGGAGEPTSGPGYAVHLYAANADMADRAFASHDGDLLLVPQEGTVDCRTEAGWLRAAPGTILVIPRGLKFAIGVPEGKARGWMLEVYGRRFRLPERGPIGSNGLADARHFLAPTASYEDRLCPAGFQCVVKSGGHVFVATQEHSAFDVVAWHGTHLPFSYDLSLFNAMGSVSWDHPDPSILTVLTAPYDDHGRATADFVVFPGRWDVAEHSFRPPYMHRNAAAEINCVVRTPAPDHGYVAGCTFVSPLLTAHGISTKSYEGALADDVPQGPRRLPDESLWVMFESSMPFRSTQWALESPLVDEGFAKLFEGMRSRFKPAP